MSVDSSDQDDDRMQYVKKDLFRPVNNPYNNNHANAESRSWYRRQSSDVGSSATNEDGDDDDDSSSNRFFVSEASTSGASEADTSENLMQLGVLGGSNRENFDCLLFLDGSADDEEDILLHDDDANFIDETLTRLPPRDPLTPPPPPPQSPPQTTWTTNKSRSIAVAGLGTTANSTADAAISLDINITARATRPLPPSTSYSPDNISLSSYDTASPNHWTRKVHVDFSPVQSKNKNSNATSSTGHHSRRHAPIDEMNTVKGDKGRNINTNGRDSITQHNFTHTTPKRLVIANKPIAANSPSNSTSEASEGEVHLLEEFLQDLRINSEGQVKESSVPGSNASFESSIILHGSTDVEDVLRRSVVAKTIPRQSQPPPPRHVTTATSSRNSFTRPLLMEHSDSFATKGADSIAMTFSDDTGDQQNLVGDRIEANSLLSEDVKSNNSEMMYKLPNNNAFSSPATTVQQVQVVPPPVPLLPPLHYTTTTTTTTIIGGGKQQRENQRRRSDDDIQFTEQNKNTVSIPRGRGNGDPRLGNYVPNSDTSNSNISSNTERSNNRNNLKSTIDHSGDEWSQQMVQEREIRTFSQFAIGTGDANDTPRRRRTRQRSNRRMRRHTQLDNGDDSSSCASSDQSYSNFSQSPTSSMPQSISDVSYESTPQLAPPPTTSELAGSPSNMQSNNDISLKKSISLKNLIQPIQSNNNRSMKRSNSLNLLQPLIQPEFSTRFGSYDGPQHGYLNHQLPPPQLNPNWAMYQPPLTGYFPGHHHQHVHTEARTMGGNMNRGTSFDQRFNFGHQPQQHPHLHHYPATMSHFERPFEPQHFFPTTPHLETTRIPDNFPHSDNNHSQNYTPSHVAGSAERQPSPQKLTHQQQKDAFINDDSHSVSDYSSDDSIENQRNIHYLHEEKNPDTKVIRHNNRKTSLFLPNGVKTTQRFDRLQFLPQISSAAGNKYPTYVCPICKTRQREFFTVSSAPKQFEGAGSYIALFFAVYVITSLYVFGLQEGWGKLDCIYFAVITLTTAGLGDLVPTTDGAKIICSLFIYVGVACIGLLLGSYIAGMLDERSYKEAIANQIKGCPNCARIQNIKDAAQRRMSGFAPTNSKVSMAHVAETHAASLRDINATKRASKKIRRSNEMPSISVSERPLTSPPMDKNDIVSNISNPPLSFNSPSIVQKKMVESPTVQKQLLGSPMTSQILNRQSHTRHISMDLRMGSIGSTTNNNLVSPLTDLNSERFRINSVDIPATVNEGQQFSHDTTSASTNRENGNNIVDLSSSSPSTSTSLSPPPLFEVPLQATGNGIDDLTVESSGSSDDTFLSDDDEIEGRNNSTVNAKYVVLTLKEAFINSLVIIAFGCLGFYLIEGFSLVDSWYFTTVLLTSTGYGDIAPKSDGGKLFATVYLLVAGTILLNNMSMISMIPLELRKRRTEQAVLDQFGDSLDDDALHELATGPLIQRINLDGKDSRGLDECTREMFALAMLIRLGKVTEDDIKQTFAAFRKLDVNNDGVLNSKSIIGGLIQKRRSSVHHNRHERSEQRRQQQATPSQGFTGSWIYPPPPPPQYYEGSVPFVPNSQVNPADMSYNTPLLSMKERSFPAYGNRPLSAPGLYE